MIKSVTRAACAFAIVSAAAASVASAQNFNGIVSQPRVFNDFPTTTLVITNSNSVSGTGFATIVESLYTDDMMGGNFANRHDFVLSSNGGATPRVLDINEPFTISADVSLSAGSNAPRKEAGFRINSPVTGDALFLINTDAGEIVAFGGGAPFKSFGNNGGGNGYTPGTVIRMGMTYKPGVPTTTGATPSTLEYFIDRPGPGGVETSGPLSWSNLEGGPVTFQVAMYGQVQPNLSNPLENLNVAFRGITAAIPEPASLGLLAIAGAALLRRR